MLQHCSLYSRGMTFDDRAEHCHYVLSRVVMAVVICQKNILTFLCGKSNHYCMMKTPEWNFEKLGPECNSVRLCIYLKITREARGL